MSTPKFICGAECGISGLGVPSAGTEHWSSQGGSPTIVTSGPATMRSTRCFHFVTPQAFFVHTFATAVGSPATVVGRCYIYFTSFPANGTLVFWAVSGATANAGISFDGSFNSLRTIVNGITAGDNGIAINTGQWYRLDFKVVFDTNSTCDAQIDGVAPAQAVATALGASTGTGCGAGATSAGLGSVDHYIDDIMVSGTSADYPLGASTCVGLYPNGDKTNSAATPTDGNGGHLYALTTNFGKGATGATNVGAQNAEATSWQSLQNPLSATTPTNFIKDAVATSTSRMAWTHGTMPAAASVNGVMLVATTHSATATANNQGMQVTDSAGANALAAWTLLDLSETTITIPVFTMATKPGGGAWDKASVDGSLIRWGLSNDVSPNPFLDGVCLEVDYVATSEILPYPRLMMIGKA